MSVNELSSMKSAGLSKVSKDTRGWKTLSEVSVQGLYKVFARNGVECPSELWHAGSILRHLCAISTWKEEDGRKGAQSLDIPVVHEV